VREAYGILDDELVIGLIGRVVKYKRADLALKVLKLVSKKMRAKLVIIGPVYDEEYFKYVRQMVIAYKLEDKVVFTGRVSFEMRDAFYSIIDILIHTSEYEAFVRPALEGWRYKKPIVSFNLTPASDFIEEEGGGVTTKRWGDYVEMAKLIEELVKRNMIEDLGENGYKALVRKYLKDKVALSYFHIYEELLDA
jgi:glycosyltransferase involved in cell wall biosynthesis